MEGLAALESQYWGRVRNPAHPCSSIRERNMPQMIRSKCRTRSAKMVLVLGEALVMRAAHSAPNGGYVVACSRCDSGLGLQHTREDGVRLTHGRTVLTYGIPKRCSVGDITLRVPEHVVPRPCDSKPERELI